MYIKGVGCRDVAVNFLMKMWGPTSRGGTDFFLIYFFNILGDFKNYII